MRPLKPAELNKDFLLKKPILLLDINKLPINSLVDIILENQFQGAAAKLPTELWLKVIDHCTTSSKFKPVVLTSFASLPHGRQLVKCKEVVDLELGDFGDRYAVMAAEEFMASTTAYKPHSFGEEYRSSEIAPGLIDPRDEERRTALHEISADEGDKEYSVIISTHVTTSLASSASTLKIRDCLFTAVTVPDIVARLDDGECWVCDGSGNICPGCTGGVAQKFDAFMGCGADLACPLCMGLDFMSTHKDFLEKYYWDPPPADEAASMEVALAVRKRELGYVT